jgi:hypothetical protein
MTTVLELLIAAAAVREAVQSEQIRTDMDAIQRAYPGDEEACVQYLCGRISWRREPGA